MQTKQFIAIDIILLETSQKVDFSILSSTWSKRQIVVARVRRPHLLGDGTALQVTEYTYSLGFRPVRVVLQATPTSILTLDVATPS